MHLYTEDQGLGGVIGFMFDRELGGNEDNPFLEAFLDNSGSQVKVNLESFLEGVDFSEYWNYNGSLTTPPCTEGIKWTVIKQVQSISDAQLKRFTDLWAGNPDFAGGKGNNREVQELKERTLYYNGAASLLAAGATALLATLAF